MITSDPRVLHPCLVGDSPTNPLWQVTVLILQMRRLTKGYMRRVTVPSHPAAEHPGAEDSGLPVRVLPITLPRLTLASH